MKDHKSFKKGQLSHTSIKSISPLRINLTYCMSKKITFLVLVILGMERFQILYLLILIHSKDVFSTAQKHLPEM
jgi:hypothetical protein